MKTQGGEEKSLERDEAPGPPHCLWDPVGLSQTMGWWGATEGLNSDILLHRLRRMDSVSSSTTSTTGLYWELSTGL